MVSVSLVPNACSSEPSEPQEQAEAVKKTEWSARIQRRNGHLVQFELRTRIPSTNGVVAAVFGTDVGKGRRLRKIPRARRRLRCTSQRPARHETNS
jgi:hypothetical protein